MRGISEDTDPDLFALEVARLKLRDHTPSLSDPTGLSTVFQGYKAAFDNLLKNYRKDRKTRKARKALVQQIMQEYAQEKERYEALAAELNHPVPEMRPFFSYCNAVLGYRSVSQKLDFDLGDLRKHRDTVLGLSVAGRPSDDEIEDRAAQAIAYAKKLCEIQGAEEPDALKKWTRKAKGGAGS